MGVSIIEPRLEPPRASGDLIGTVLAPSQVLRFGGVIANFLPFWVQCFHDGKPCGLGIFSGVEDVIPLKALQRHPWVSIHLVNAVEGHAVSFYHVVRGFPHGGVDSDTVNANGLGFAAVLYVIQPKGVCLQVLPPLKGAKYLPHLPRVGASFPVLSVLLNKGALNVGVWGTLCVCNKVMWVLVLGAVYGPRTHVRQYLLGRTAPTSRFLWGCDTDQIGGVALRGGEGCNSLTVSADVLFTDGDWESNHF